MNFWMKSEDWIAHIRRYINACMYASMYVPTYVCNNFTTSWMKHQRWNPQSYMSQKLQNHLDQKNYSNFSGGKLAPITYGSSISIRVSGGGKFIRYLPPYTTVFTWKQGRDILSSCNAQYFHTTDIPTQDLTFVVSLVDNEFSSKYCCVGLITVANSVLTYHRH